MVEPLNKSTFVKIWWTTRVLIGTQLYKPRDFNTELAKRYSEMIADNVAEGWLILQEGEQDWYRYMVNPVLYNSFALWMLDTHPEFVDSFNSNSFGMCLHQVVPMITKKTHRVGEQRRQGVQFQAINIYRSLLKKEKLDTQAVID